jgi:hypothetical protein
LDALCPLILSNIDANPGDVAARPCEIRHNTPPDWIGEDPDDRNRAGGRLNIEHEAGESDDQIWIPTHYPASEVRIMRDTPFAGIALDQPLMFVQLSLAVEIARA